MQTILIITQDFDPTVDPVVEYLSERDVRTVRFDLSDFPSTMSLEANDFTDQRRITVRNVTVDLEEVTSVWYRRPTVFEFDEELLDNEREFAKIESAHGVGGLFRSMDNALWVNRPDAESVAQLKPYQLHLARILGLRTPRTLITNDPRPVRRLLEQGERLVYKIFGGGLVQIAGEMPSLIFTTEITGAHDNMLERVQSNPCIFQELLSKRLEVRMTVIGRTILPATIDSQADQSTQLDWRGANSGRLRYAPALEVPEEVVSKTLELVERLDLAFAAVDFVIDDEGRWVFLEINPGGQFMWLEDDVGLPMTATMGNLLMAGRAALTDEPKVIYHSATVGRSYEL